ncbi:site-specific integrase [Yersinia rochesterensis]|uniref:site-specific integrase n=1 Tax=Yersinia rochesterensis TaxID=1604335 RepID=UPI0011A2DD28|nr:site-specific integrase [Yersinia rochesterensis]
MPIYKRGKTYWIDVSTPDGTRIRRSSGTEEKLKAQRLHDKIKHELWAVANLDKRPEKLFEDLIVLALRDAEGQSSFANKQIYARYWLNVFGGRIISSISGEEITDNLPTHNLPTRKRLANATKNRYRSFIMRGFSLADKSGWLDRQPYAQSLREPKVRIRWIEKSEAKCLIDNLRYDWMKHVCSFALLTGARLGEILSLKWKDVDLGRRVAVITADNAKSGKARPLPLNDDAVSIMRKIPCDNDFVFSSNGDREGYINRTDFDRAMSLSGIEDFRFHDLRHTWASWHVQNGTPLMVLKELGGWEKLEMVNKYAHLSGEHLSKFSGIVTFLAHDAENADTKNRISLVS